MIATPTLSFEQALQAGDEARPVDSNVTVDRRRPLERARWLDGRSPADVAEALRDLPGLALLESARAGRRGRWTYLTADPIVVLEAPSGGPDPLAEARRELRRLAVPEPGAAEPGGFGSGGRGSEPSPPFRGGLVGFLGYDVGRYMDDAIVAAPDDRGIPPMRLALHDWVVAWDGRSGAAWLAGIACDGDVGVLENRLATVRERLRGAQRLPSVPAGVDPRLAGFGVADVADPSSPGDADPGLAFRSSLSRSDFEAAVRSLKDAIADGQIYQANLTRRLEAAFGGDPWMLYRCLRDRDPSLFAAYLDLGPGDADASQAGRRAIVSASPEPFLAVEPGGYVSTDPIKGTRPRGSDPGGDRRLARELLASTKDRAENVMIVDVLRNDLGRVCRPGSVRVPRLCRLERTSAVQHLVSTVTGDLGPDCDAFDLLAAAFPGGSITGAPKIRATQLIADLEPVARGPYTGALGWIGPDGAMGTSILIRTFVADGQRLTLHVGGGITGRSDPAEEWAETVAKARGPLRAIGGHEVDGPAAGPASRPIGSH